MAWSDEFIRECDQRRRAPVYLVESLPRDASPSWGVGRSWSAATHRGYGSDADLVSVSWSPPTLNITGWASTMGGFSFVLRRWDNAVDTLRRGYVLAHNHLRYANIGAMQFCFDVKNGALVCRFCFY